MSADVLQSIAEVAIALAGFGGIAAGLGYRARGVWSDEDQVRLLGMAATGLVVVFACFLPYTVEHMGSSAPWRTSGIVLLVAQLTGLVLTLRVLVPALRAAGSHPGGYSRVAAALGIAAQLSAIALLAVLSFGYAVPREFGFYLSSVLLDLLRAAIFFVRLLVTSFRDEPGPAA